jgi:16S rRNA (cytosine967-C5)-methyltransferase
VVLVDAPCSGLGTLGHRPDLLARLRDEAAWDALVETQRAILAAVAPLVRPGGALVYAVCTLTRAEGDDVVAARAAADGGRWAWVEAPAVQTPTEALGHDGPARVVLRSDLHGTDGFVIHRMRRGG